MARHPDNTWLVVDRAFTVIAIAKSRDEAESLILEAEQRYSVIANALPPLTLDDRPLPRPRLQILPEIPQD